MLFLMLFRYVIVVLYATQEYSTGRLTPYCLALQWHDYMSLLRTCVVCYNFTIICLSACLSSLCFQPEAHT